MILTLAVVVAVAIVLPHVLSLERASAATAATLWAVALGLRALAGVFAALYVVLFVPTTELFDELTQWCWHTIIPYITTHLGLSGHGVGDAVIIVPSVLLAVSAASIGFGIWRACRAVRRLLAHESIGDGPAGSVIIGGPGVIVAAAGLARPRLVVSAGALVSLDDDELAASLDHEHGHIKRRHRFVLLYAEACRALGRCVPGTSAALRGLRFELERDADGWALGRAHDPLALASAIYKAAVSPAGGGPAVASLADGDVIRRVDELLAAPPPLRRSTIGLLNVLAATGVTLVIALSIAVPLALATGAQRAVEPQAMHRCSA